MTQKAEAYELEASILHTNVLFYMSLEAQKRNWERKVELVGGLSSFSACG